MGNFQDEYEISAADRVGKGVTGLPDTPGLSTGDMQARFDSLGNLAIDKFNAVVECVDDTVTNDDKKLPTMKAIVDYVSALGGGDMMKAIYDTDDDGVVNNSAQLGGQNPSHYRNQYAINLPTTGYTTATVTIGGVSMSVQKIIINADKDGNPLTNFSAGLREDYPLNLTGTTADFGKLIAYEMGNGSVTCYLTSVPTTAFNVLIREAT